MDSVVPFVIPRGWISIPSGVNTPKCFQTCQQYLSLLFSIQHFQGFFTAFFPFLFCTTLATTLTCSHVSYLSGYCLHVEKLHLWSVICLSLPHRLECWLQWLCTLTESIYFKDLWEALARPIYFSQIWPKFIQYSELKLS